MSSKEILEDTRLWPVAWFILICLVIFAIVFPYLNSILLTKLYIKSESSFLEICQARGDIVKKVQILDYQPQYLKAQIDCLYTNPKQNLRIRLFKNNKNWEVNNSRLLNKPRNFYWPIFL